MLPKKIVKRFIRPLLRPFAYFFRTQALSGIILFVSSLLALLLANSNWGVAQYFPEIWATKVTFSINSFILEKDLSHWINDGLMALFFLVVGLEIKRELIEGELATWRQASLPLVSALGGMVMPALLFVAANVGQPTVGGWGIPMATDIAFALAVLLLLGDRVPIALKVFLTALAIADDLGAVLVISLFYTNEIHLNYLAGAGGILLLLTGLNVFGMRSLPVYLLLGLVLWYFTLKSGVHATLAGVLLAFTIPFKIGYNRDDVVVLVEERLSVVRQTIIDGLPVNTRNIGEEIETLSKSLSSPAQRLENRLHAPIAYAVIPVFAFCNTSLPIEPSLVGQLGSPVSVGILLGLVVGKPLGILLFSFVSVRAGWAALPAGVNWRQLAGAACLAGIGFTMSVFITLLAFNGQPDVQNVAKLAIVVASVVSGIVGYTLLRTGRQ